MHRAGVLALLVLLAMAFALGLTFDSIAGWAVSYDTPSVADACRDPETMAACATLASAEATATIARWTRLDTIFSLFTGLAALFAFLAYKESRAARTAAEEQAAAATQMLDDERARARGTLILDKCRVQVSASENDWSDFGDEPVEKGEARFLTFIEFKADGPSSLRDLQCKLEVDIDLEDLDGRKPFRRFQRDYEPIFSVVKPSNESIGFKTWITFVEPCSISTYRAISRTLHYEVRAHFLWRDQFEELHRRSFELAKSNVSPTSSGFDLRKVSELAL